MFRYYNKFVSIEIGDGLVKAMYIMSNAKESRLIDFAMIAVNFRQGRNGIVKAIKDVLQKMQINSKKVRINICVSGESVVVRDIRWPQMNDIEIRKALRFEVERQVNCKIEDVVFDYYSVLDEQIDETKTRLVLVAAKKNLIENYIGLLSLAGYRTKLVEVDTFSLLNCFYLNAPENVLTKTITVLNVGMEVTNIDIIKGKIVGLTKDAFVAWGNLIDALPKDVVLDFNNISALKGINGSNDIYDLCIFIVNALFNQVRRAIEFYENQNSEDSVEAIFLCGRIAMFKNLDKYLQNLLGLKVTIWNPIAKLKYNPKLVKKEILQKNALMLAICTGLACHRYFKINLSPVNKKIKESAIIGIFSKNRKLFLSAAAVCVFLFALWLLLFIHVQIKKADEISLKTKSLRLQKISAELNELNSVREILGENVQIFSKVFLHKIYWSKKLYEINKFMPQDIWLTDLYLNNVSAGHEKGNPAVAANSLQKVMTLVIKGKVYCENNDKMLSVINQLVTNLKDVPSFSNDFSKIALIRSSRELIGESFVMCFEIQCLFK